MVQQTGPFVGRCIHQLIEHRCPLVPAVLHKLNEVAGMRAMMAVLRAAGNLKRQHPAECESGLLLQCITDASLGKLLTQDVQPFQAIVSDLFPGVATLPTLNTSALEAALRARCKANSLQPTDYFLTKTMQLYEMLIAHHGVMTVGLPFSGKTASLRMLAEALTSLADSSMQGALFQLVHIKTINPKAVTMGQLFGGSDGATKEWKDGVLGCTFRALASDPSPDCKWCVLDGPVDGIWIESMNTVLDNTRRLCLPNSERIAMHGSMSIIIEVGDLAAASPATVSRCGMVHLDSAHLGWEPLLTSWLTTLPAALDADLVAHFERLFRWMLPPCLAFVRRTVKEQYPTENSALATNAMRLVLSLLDEFQAPRHEDAHGDARDAATDAVTLPAPAAGMDAAVKIKWVEAIFVFAVTWSVGATGGAVSRTAFDAFFRELTSGATPSVCPPSGVAHFEEAIRSALAPVPSSQS
jgi:dynein heavy chain, axonemal